MRDLSQRQKGREIAQIHTARKGQVQNVRPGWQQSSHSALVATVVIVSVSSPSHPLSHWELFKVRDYSSMSLVLSSPEFNDRP